ncbi:heat shock protein family A (Hsp70) member 12A.3 [Scleropages formosus]|uniref:Heat shock protein family A (Hsp70) member 12A.1 n=1 Tax=Scleropages formosus TaxID=113540 RepID=A0A8C9RD31_SCLFO|nr:heat shock 70 kDa protein 12A-like [Scleropages formosus]
MSDSFFIVAVDFGTSYSGYCFCVQSNLDDVRMVYWGHEVGLKTSKTPTCVLLDEHGEFLKFGYEAVMTYTRMGRGESARKLYFNNFKMQLYNKEISRDLMVTAANGRPFRAMKVFSESLRYLKDHALSTIGEHTSGKEFIASDVTWVLTVPAIWTAAAKQFMREAAVQAGLVSDFHSNQLIVALEPEAASVWCKHLPSEGFVAEGASQDNRLEQSPGTQYVVVDCGGGTIDITVHEVLESGSLKELLKASGGDMGGETVTKKYLSFLRDLFTPETWDQYEKENPSEVQKMIYDFTVQKCVGEDGDIFIQCPYNLAMLAGSKQDMSRYFQGVQGVFWLDGTFKVTYSKLRSFFEESVQKVTILIQNITSNPEINVEFILLVGGYASCKILQKKIREHFSSRCKVLCPVDAQLAIVKGAVLFGNDPKIMASRVSALTYGIDIARSFDESKHKKEKRRVNKKGDYVYCEDIFLTMVQNGQSVNCDEVSHYDYYPIDDDQTAMRFRFYSTERLNPMYVDECGVKKIGSFVVPMPDTTQGRQRRVRVDIKFGSTEIQAAATDLTSNETRSIRLDFLTK